MAVAAAAAPIPAPWVEDPVPLSAREECREARAAWELVAPADGLLPEDATPLQYMLFARMTTSAFIYQVARHRNLRRTGAVLP